MTWTVSEAPMSALSELGTISIAFEVRSRFEVSEIDRGLGGLGLTELPVTPPYVKDYDAIEGEGPARWARRFDIANWGLFLARSEVNCVGGAVIAFRTPGVNMLEGRNDLAVLWDLRVAPGHRGQGIGSALMSAAAAWAEERQATWLKIETQNINVAACRFYAAQGCRLGAIHRYAYRELPDEVQLLWYLALRPGRVG
jgi:ribosomal protein S18 acetylase RimI-like enzyme